MSAPRHNRTDVLILWLRKSSPETQAVHHLFERIDVNGISIDKVMMLQGLLMIAGADARIALPPRPFRMIMFEPVLHL